MFDMSGDSSLFRTRDSLVSEGWRLEGSVFLRDGARYLPLYEAKMFHLFDHRWTTYQSGVVRDMTSLEKANASCPALPRYWVEESEKAKRSVTEALLVWRDICRSTDERTELPAVIPGYGAGDTVLIAHLAPGRPVDVVVASWSSFVADYVARQKIGGTHLKYHYFKQLPVIGPETYRQRARWADEETLEDWIRSRVLELTYTAWDLEGFARDVGYGGPPFRWDDVRRALLRAELDACFFHLYGIDRDDVDYIMETFPIVKRKDMAANDGEYVTKRRILDCYDAMAKAVESGETYATVLNPPPADPSVAHDPATRPEWADLLLSQASRTVPP